MYSSSASLFLLPSAGGAGAGVSEALAGAGAGAGPGVGAGAGAGAGWVQLCQVLGSTQPLCMHLGWPDPPLGVTAGSAQLQANSANSWNNAPVHIGDSDSNQRR